MWLLTGDQQDTAINIGLSSCLLNNNSNLMILNDKTYRRCERTLEKFITEMKNNDEWGYPMIKYNKKDKNEDDSIMYDERYDKNFNNSKLSYKWEKNVLVVNGDALAAIFGSRPVKKDKNNNNNHPHNHNRNHSHSHYHHHGHNRINSSNYFLNKENRSVTKSQSFINNKLSSHKKNDYNRIYPENFNINNDTNKGNNESKVDNNIKDDTAKDRHGTIDNNNDIMNNNDGIIVSKDNNKDAISNSNNTNNINKYLNIKFLNINDIIMTSIGSIRNTFIALQKKQRQREREKNKKREEEKKKKKNKKPYNPKDLTPLQRKFVEVGIRCRTVICCRVTPIQKANVVKAVRHNLKAVTLAIGDGANDVAMIQAAHIGVGIMGREGAQAVRASDYAFLEFRFLKPLLCVHGRYTYLQITKLILYSFYKNIVLSLILFSYGFVSLWSGNVCIIKIT